MANVIEFYVPEYFRKPHKSAPQMQLGKVMEFALPTKPSAFLWLELSLAYEKSVSETLVDLDHARR